MDGTQENSINILHIIRKLVIMFAICFLIISPINSSLSNFLKTNPFSYMVSPSCYCLRAR